MRLLTAVLLAPFCILAAYAADDSLPAPPPGFQWYDAKNGVGAFLQPDGWFVKEESREGTHAVFISREEIGSSGRFIVGFSVNELTQISKRGVKASEFARSYAHQLTRTTEVLKSGVVEGNASDMHVARLRGDNNGISTITQHIAIGNDALDSAYILIFEAPEKEWDVQIEKGGPMLNFFALGE